ncbi:myb-like protein F [Eupeodes corollae]|uniref:myb-like protein F n=1 Tax=Eupeodes corollae TaxID=290404 RepID=UPI002492AF9A|nr:myb-like protein F [Eupeodes corollae]
MAIDMNLISLKDGGRFAMSWIAGTNPKSLRSTCQRQQIYSVDVQEVCEEMIESIKMKEDKLSFRILFRLCFGTIHIYAEQVKHLYDVTLSFVCFNTFVMKQYSRKRLSSNVGDDSYSKRIRLDSSEDLDISSLLMETEVFNEYTEDKFRFPNELGHNDSRRQKNTSTCIQINQITIRHVSWDNPMPETEDEFGDASQDERNILISGLNETMDSTRRFRSQKRKPCYDNSECSSFKKPCLLNESNESLDDFRYDSSFYDETISEAGLETQNETIQDTNKNITDYNDNNLTQIDFESTRKDTFLEDQYQSNVTENSSNRFSLEDSKDTPLPDLLQEYINRTNDKDNIVNTSSRIDSPNSNLTLDEIPRSATLTERKRKHSQILIDTNTKLPKLDCEDIWKHCYDIDKGDHLASPKDCRKPILFNKRIANRRVQNDKLLSRFNKNVKLRLQQDHNYNRELIVEEILGDDYEEFKNLLKIKTSYGEMYGRKKSQIKDKIQQFDDYNNNNIIENNNTNTNCTIINDNNNNLQIDKEQIHLQIETNSGYVRCERENNGLTLNCELHEIDPFAISFDFPVEAGHQRSEWGKEGIMTKLLFAWVSEEPIVNMKSIIVGANRINAALAFHTLLDLSGQQYIEIIKDETNSIESIEMGPEIIKLINKIYS